jgi:hypothetical protein
VLVVEHRGEVSSERAASQTMLRLGMSNNATGSLTFGYGQSMQKPSQGGFVGGAALRLWGTAAGQGDQRLDLGAIWSVQVDQTSDSPVSGGVTGAATVKINDELAVTGNLGFSGAVGTSKEPGSITVTGSLGVTSGPFSAEVNRSRTYVVGGPDQERTSIGLNFRLYNSEGPKKAGQIYANPFMAVTGDVGKPKEMVGGIGVTAVLGGPLF